MSHSHLIIINVIIVTLNLVNGQVPGLGACPKIETVPNFDANRYLGLWYEVEKYPFIFTLGGKCVTAEYGLNPNGTISVFNKQIRNNKEDTILGTARVIKPGVGVLGVTFPNVPFQGEANYNILDTDYDSYAVVYSCTSFLGLVNGKIVWILFRDRHPPKTLLDRARQVLTKNRISTNYLATTDNKNCPGELSNRIDNFRN